MPKTVRATAPAKCILFGEHAVVFGEPAVAMALDLTTTVRISSSDAYRVDGLRLDPKKQPYISSAVERLWRGAPDEVPLAFAIESSVPTASGLGSSAALTVATVAGLSELQGKLTHEERVARLAFECESGAQDGRGSPCDTSVSTHGKAIFIGAAERPGLLWRIERDGKRWAVHHIEPPPFRFVIGNTGIRGRTTEQVAKVRRFCERSSFARDLVKEIGDITVEGAEALAAGDAARTGDLMNRNHRALAALGVNCPELQRLVDAALRAGAKGAKLTGAGGGGCMVALAENPEAVAEGIKKAGGIPIMVAAAGRGVRVEK